eukprot:gnl/MRDRNA2_/MRDRNA2_219325_c0_seq1.p1 gnl/MRDRNA2_/MRDRNA2_219325_c0~~gnl/MRDRNA2_/MRDRNA2_219325_c0_seq1.p1  ORF type:complete len:383 (+),score=39.72 gnl/MRDRNA2_/MRDRNA2_219325_c0_seq1:135-1151(+)
MAVAVIFHSIIAQMYAPSENTRGQLLKRESFAWGLLAAPDTPQRHPASGHPVIVGNPVGNPAQVHPGPDSAVPPSDKMVDLVPIPEAAPEDLVVEPASPPSTWAHKDESLECEKSRTRPRSLSTPVHSVLSPSVIGSISVDSLSTASTQPGTPSKDHLLSHRSDPAHANALSLDAALASNKVGESCMDKFTNLAAPAAKTPVLWGVFVGITLNLTGVPFYPLPAMALKALTGAFPPLLYFLLGASLRFNLSCSSYSTVVRILLARQVMCVLAVAFVRFIYPLDDRTRSILTLSLFAPIATTFIMFAGQHGYKMDIVAMIKNISDVFSMILLNVIVGFV